MYRELSEAGNPSPKYEQIASMIVGAAYSSMFVYKENIENESVEFSEYHVSEKTAVNPPVNPPVNFLDSQIVQLMSENPRITYNELARITERHRDTIREHVKNLQQQGLVTRVGPDKGGHWQVNERADG